MASILKFDEWQNTAGVKYGTVLQVVHQPYNVQVAFSSTSYQDLFSATITPKFQSSNILIYASAAFSGKGSFSVFRGGDNLFPGVKTYQVYVSSAGQTAWNSGSIRNPLMITTMNLANTTNEITYTMRGASYSTTAAEAGGINEGGGSHQGTSITLIEIAA